MIKVKYFGLVLFCIIFVLTVTMMLPSPLQAHTISGTVMDTGGGGIDGVTLGFDNGETTTTEVTSGEGLYSHTVDHDWTGTVTPSHDCYSFTPASPLVGPVGANIIQNFTGTLLTRTISGLVSDGPPVFDVGGNLINPVSGAAINLSTGDGTTSGPDGSYSLTVNCGWGGIVTPMMEGWEFSPPSISYEIVNVNYFDQNFTGALSNTIHSIPMMTEWGTILFVILMGTAGVLYMISGQRRGQPFT